MTLTMSPRMAKMGRPRKEDGESGTTQLRVYDDLAEMISDLRLVLTKTTAQLIDEAARRTISDLHAKYKSQIEKVKAAHLAAEAAIQKAQEEAEQMDRPKGSTSPRRPKAES